MPSQRPRLTTPGPLLQGSGELHIVGPHEVVTVPDPLGAMQRLLRLADGSRTSAEIYAALTIAYPQLSEQDFAQTLSELEEAGVLEEGAPRNFPVRAPAPRRDVHARSLFRGAAPTL
jgi:hypothetical protein